MAVSKGKSLPVSLQPKSALYQKLFNLHQAFEILDEPRPAFWTMPEYMGSSKRLNPYNR